MTKFLNISRDNTMGGNSPSHDAVSSQRAIKEYVDGRVDRQTTVEEVSANTTRHLQFGKQRHLHIVHVVGGVTTLNIEVDTDVNLTHTVIVDNNENSSSLKVTVTRIYHKGRYCKTVYCNSLYLGLSNGSAPGSVGKIRITADETNGGKVAVVETREDMYRPEV